MKLKLQLVRDGETIFEMPLSPTDWPREQLENELEALEEDFQRLSKIFNALSNETRLMMMRRLIEEDDRTINFADFMRDLELNPKTVWENTRKLREGGLLKKAGRGRYRCSDLGQSAFMMMNLALRRLTEALEELENL
ncbi:MAG: ArsR/SmtB family transcription factor [Candidatus Bathyarchaeia archaeon]